ncbi:MAG: hypothetical protein IK013_08380 [Bacteroidales bacterium]|nr:hypothetical protein [Bacteroidales bacterium]
MKIKLKLTRMEMKGIATVVQNCCNALAGVTFPEVQYRDALSGLLLKLAGKMMTLKQNNRMTLTEVEALALYEVLNDLADRMPPLEMGVSYTVLGEIDKQRMSYVSLMRGNLASIVNDGQNLIPN